ncbi:UNVERIFIED_CONTAM: hypothetical protein PYX00_005385 [Menopon gallinae]|uniref:Beta-glucuronidase n=1 Tax=Menopon gallinae TaxID=328185 RepID=A0AAW2HR54_9NEOP
MIPGRVLSVFLLYTLCSHESEGILYPRDSETRTVKSLDGIWNFRLSLPWNYTGHFEEWYLRGLKETGPTIPMPVPASYNDITVHKNVRDHVGIVWYEKEFFVPENWRFINRIWLRFGSVCYAAQVWVNGDLVMTHEIGHLPFETEITNYLSFGRKNFLTVSVDNTLLQTTVPQGKVFTTVAGNKTIPRQQHTFDFFNYAGIDRSVFLYTTPNLYISDITVIPSVSQDLGTLTYRIDYIGEGNKDYNSSVSCQVSLFNRQGFEAAKSYVCQGSLLVKSPKLWWPYLMDPDPGYLYEMKVEITDGRNRDIYRLKVGIRTVRWTKTELLINEKPVYIRGVGKHEDSDIRGKGLDLPLIVKDFELLKWLGVNTFRTSHYPYADEIMDFADEMGIMVINECPSVDTDIFSDTLLQKHKKSLTELIRRDKNRPSVIMWSVANEPRTQKDASVEYFKKVVTHVKALDTTRPVTMAVAQPVAKEMSAQFMDIICFNRYNSWYMDTGVTEVIVPFVIDEAQKWFEKYQKPVMMCEYGADAFAGLHTYPEIAWGEEYQVKVLEEHFKAFDELRTQGFFVGEMVWNFADFKTGQGYTRVDGNKKGIFTRQRQPKSVAFLLRKRYNELAHELDGAALFEDIYTYSSSLGRALMTS